MNLRQVRVKIFLGLLSTSCWAVEGPSLDYLEKGLNKVTYSEILMESDPPTSEKTLPDGTKMLFWDDSKFVYIDGIGNSKRKNKTCYLNSKGVLVRYKWKDGIWGGDSKEDGDHSSSKGKVKSSGSSSR